MSSEHPRIDTCLPPVTSIIRTRCLFMNGWTIIHHSLNDSLNVTQINKCSTFNFTAFTRMLLQIQLVKRQDVNYKNPFFFFDLNKIINILKCERVLEDLLKLQEKSNPMEAG